MSLSHLTVDAWTVVFTFLAASDLTTCTALDRRTHKLINTPTPRDSFLWRTLAARLLQQHYRLPFIPPPPLVLSPYTDPSLSYFHVLAFTTPWPIGFATLPLVTAPGHRHEVLVEGDWSWDEVQHEHTKLMRAVEDSSDRDGMEDKDKSSSMDEADGKGEHAADEAMDEKDEQEEEDEGEEGEGSDDDEDEDEEFDGENDNEDEDGEEEGVEEDEDDEDDEDDEEEEEAEAAEEEADEAPGRQAQQAGDARRIDLRAMYQMLDVLDSLTRNTAPQQRADDEQQAAVDDNGPMVVRDRRDFHRFFGRLFRMQGSSEDEVARAAEAYMAQRRRAEEDRRRRQERKRRDEERRAQMMQRAFVDVGALMDADDEASRRAQRQQHKKLDKQQRRWRDIVDAAMAQRPAPTYSSSDDEDSDDEKQPAPPACIRSEQVATRLRYANNTHGDDRAVVLDRAFPMRLADHAVPFTVVEVVTRDRLEAMLRERDRVEDLRRKRDEEDNKQMEADGIQVEGSGKEEKQEDETSKKRKHDQSREVEEKKQKVDSSTTAHSRLSLTRTRSLSNLSSPYYTFCRLSSVAYFEVHIEEADAEVVNRRELRQKEEREKLKRQRLARREQRLSAGEEVDLEEEEAEAEDEQAEHLFSRHPDCVSVGLATSAFPLVGKQPGWDRSSYGYHGDDGAVFHGSGVGSKRFGPTYGVGDVVGCGLDYRDGSVFFTKNGRFLGVHPSTVSAGGEDSNGLLGEWYGVVGLDSGSVVRVSVAGPWVFDVVSYERHTGKRQQQQHAQLGWEVETSGAGAAAESLSHATAELKRLWRTETRKRHSA